MQVLHLPGLKAGTMCYVDDDGVLSGAASISGVWVDIPLGLLVVCCLLYDSASSHQ